MSPLPLFTAGDRRQILCQLAHANDLIEGPALTAWADSVAWDRYDADREAGTVLDVLFPVLPTTILCLGVEQAQAMADAWHRMEGPRQ